MKRRTFLASVSTTAAVGIAGCTGGSGDGGESGGGSDGGETVVDETVTGNDTATFRFDAESGQTITVYAENAQGYSVHVLIRDPDGGDVLNEQVDTEDTFSRTAEATGAYSAHVTPTGESGAEGVVQIEVE